MFKNFSFLGFGFLYLHHALIVSPSQRGLFARGKKCVAPAANGNIWEPASFCRRVSFSSKLQPGLGSVRI